MAENKAGARAARAAGTAPEQADLSDIDATRLRSAIEFALSIVRNSKGVRPAPSYPPKLDRFAKLDRVPNGSLNVVRKVIESDDEFRSLVGAHAVEDVVDELGLLWLRRPEGWEASYRHGVAAADAADAERSAAAQLKRMDKRRDAAERAATRAIAELAGRDRRIAELASEAEELHRSLVSGGEELEAMRAELADARQQARHARDRERSANKRLDAALARLAELDVGPAQPSQTAEYPDHGGTQDENAPLDVPLNNGGSEPGRGADIALGDRVAQVSTERLSRLLAVATDLVEQVGRLAPDVDLVPDVDDGDDGDDDDLRKSERTVRHPQGSRSGRSGGVGRKPLRMPPGVIADSAKGAEFLFGSGAAFYVDGYNVTKMAWPGRSLVAQRDALIAAAERLSARFGTDITIAFDGAEVVGSHAERRLGVRVVYSAPGQIADDLIRNEVALVPNERAVVVVTNDREILDAVGRRGANLMTSERFVDTCRAG